MKSNDENKYEEDAIERSSRCSNRLIAILRSKGQLSENGLPEAVIHRFISDLACFDTNNRYDKKSIGAGEREGRIASSIVYNLHMGLAHGMGRSGNLMDQQPKAIGSSLLAKIANSLALDAIRCIGIPNTQSAIILPVATGMSLAFCLSAWRQYKPNASYVVFLRIDQQSCFKSIFVAGYKPIVIDCVNDEQSDHLITDLSKLNSILEEKHEEILAVMSTTSCFAPRSPDNLIAVGELCNHYSIKHLVNNAYGLQSMECCQRINIAGGKGHIDAFIQSLDKNFLVPVGGSIIATFNENTINSIAQFYPGRASLVPSRDLLITLLHLGRNGIQQIYKKQNDLFKLFKNKAIEMADKIGERILITNDNLTSIALTLCGLPSHQRTLLGSMLFDRGITGARVVCGGVNKTIFGYTFNNYGSHSTIQQPPYLNISCAIGMGDDEVLLLIDTIEKQYKYLLEHSSNN